MIGLVVAVALAQDPPPPEPPSDGVQLTVRVGPEAIAEARQGVVDALRPLGWTVVRRDDGVTVFKPPRAWLGRARLYDDGRFDFGRRVVVLGVDAPVTPLTTYNPDQAYGQPLSLTPTFAVLPARRKLSPHWEAAATTMWPALTQFRTVLSATATEERLAGLPGRLDALWEDGTPLYGSDPLPDAASRRAALLDLWATRADTPEGNAVADLVAAYLSEVVDRSPTPTTAEERADADARRADVRAAEVAP